MRHLYYGPRRVAKKYMRWYFTPQKEPREFYDWACKLRPGDIIHVCFGYNCRISAMEVEYFRVGPRTKVLQDMVFLEDNFRYHYLDCIGWPLSRDEQEANILLRDNAEGLRLADAYKWRHIIEGIPILKAGGHIFDEDGLILPQYRYLWKLP